MQLVLGNSVMTALLGSKVCTTHNYDEDLVVVVYVAAIARLDKETVNIEMDIPLG